MNQKQLVMKLEIPFLQLVLMVFIHAGLIVGRLKNRKY